MNIVEQKPSTEVRSKIRTWQKIEVIIFAIFLAWFVFWPIFEGIGLYEILDNIAIGVIILIIVGLINAIKNKNGKKLLYWIVVAIEMVFIWLESSQSITVGCATTWPSFLSPFPMPISSSGDLCQFGTSVHTPLFFIAVDVLVVTLLVGLVYSVFVLMRDRQK
jgi:hypothetical protein